MFALPQLRPGTLVRRKGRHSALWLFLSHSDLLPRGTQLPEPVNRRLTFSALFPLIGFHVR